MSKNHKILLEKEIDSCPINVYSSNESEIEKICGAKTAAVFCTTRSKNAYSYFILLNKMLPVPMQLFALLHEIEHYNHKDAAFSQARKEKMANLYAVKTCFEKGYKKSLDFGLDAIYFLATTPNINKCDKQGAMLLIKSKQFQDILKKIK